MRTYLQVGVSLLFASLLQAKTTGDLGLSLGLDNKVGIGTFLPKNRAENQLISTLVFAPFLVSGPLFDNKKLKLWVEQKLDVEWLESKANPSQKVSLYDLYIRASIKNAFSWPRLNLALTPTLESEIPFSKVSMAANRLFGLGANTALTWSLSGFSLVYKPSLAGYFHNEPDKVNRCDNILGNCTLIERQTTAMLKNTLSTIYISGNHSFNLSFRTYHAFLRELKADEFVGTKAEDVKISTLGYLEYVYAFPSSIPFSLTLGISSLQPLRNAQGKVNFPFFDFKTPAKNYSQLYCNLEAVFS